MKTSDMKIGDAQIYAAMQSFVARQERLVASMLSAWDYEAWGRPAIARRGSRLSHTENARHGVVQITSDILGLTKADAPIGGAAVILVFAQDHMEAFYAN